MRSASAMSAFTVYYSCVCQYNILFEYVYVKGCFIMCYYVRPISDRMSKKQGNKFKMVTGIYIVLHSI